MNNYRKKAKMVLILCSLFITLYLLSIIFNSVNFIHNNNENVQKSKESIYENPLSDEKDNILLEELDFEAKLPQISSPDILNNYTMIVGNPYSWIDATGGTELSLWDDDYSTQSLPFNFQFYNETYSTIYVGSNGYLSFTDSMPWDWTNDPIPSADPLHTYLIAPFWDDLYTAFAGGGGTIYVQSFGTYWVAEWLNIQHLWGPTVGTFEVILYDNGDIVFNYDYISYVAGGYTCGLNLGIDTSYYNVYSGLTASTNDFSLLFTPPSNDYAPQLSSESVIPTTGTQLTVFNFSTTYTDLDNNQPSSINVIINDTAYPMTQQNLSDTNYTDGCIFHYNTYLNPAAYNYTYYFNCSDGVYSNSTTLKSDLNVTRVNPNSPTLSNGQVIPNSGYYGISDFTFIVNYSDVDNNAPIFINVTINSTTYLLSKENINDNNYTDGCMYNVTTKLNVPGNYNYTFYCYDGFTDSLGPFTDLNVLDPGLNAINITSPANITYIEPYPGYYPATYGFENDADGTVPIGWDDYSAGTTTSLVESDPLDGHKNYIKMNDNDGTARCEISNYFTSQENGTVELWIRSDDVTDLTRITLRDASYTRIVGIKFDLDNVQNLDATWNTFYASPVDGTWYRLRIDFECGNGGYLGLAADTYNIYIYDISGIELGKAEGANFNILTTGIRYLTSSTHQGDSDYISYIDAVGYSWDDNYAIGDNLEKGILLNITTLFTPNYSCYSLDGQNNKTIWNNVAVMAIPTDGFHTVQVFANTSTGIWFKSEIVNFTTNLINDNQPTLTQGTVIPKMGNQLTKFNFTVIYTDLDNNHPIYINVTINGTSYEMQKRDNSDDNYTDGCLYQYITYLAPDPFNYTYSFNASDSDFAVSTALYNDLEVNVVNNFYPELQNAEVNPIFGINSTLFNYTVYYFDADNNLPLFVNITINNTGTFEMEKADPSDFNATDGILYYYNTTLTWGYYQFQINCSDESYPNSTGWIIGPEVNPFYGIGISSQQIIMNEICSSPDFIEMYNYGSDQDMTGWYIIVYHNNAIDIIYNFPDGWIFKSNYVVVLHESTGTDTDTDLYTGVNIMWQTAPLAAGLFDNTGANIDWVQTSTHTLPRPPDAEWTQDVSWTISSNYAYRTSDIDNNLASDWTVASSGSQGVLNPGQTGIGPSDGLLDLLTPINTSSIFNGWNNFSWASLEPYFGSVNYTLQISSTSDFTFVNIEKTKILETPVNTTVEIDVNLVADLYFWRVRANYDIFKSNWSEIYSFNLIINNFTPNLSSVEVIPLYGSQMTKFNFTVVYSDQDNNSPIYVNVTINGTSHSMSQVNLLDTDYTDGCIFQYLTKLSPAAFNYTYSFICYDGKYANSTILYDNLEVTEINLIAPTLINPELNPSIGDNSTLFIFTVWYYDIENNQLTIINITINDTGTFLMEKADPLDFNATDGILYYYNTTLSWGYYKFQINCSDGVFTNSTGWIIGPEVNPFKAGPTTVAVLNSDSSNEPSYFYGGWGNDYNTIYNGLIGQGVDAVVITNADIISGVLSSIGTLILVDNCPNDAASTIVKDWCVNGGTLITFDSSICFLNWAGILPPEAVGTDGNGVYWEYSSLSQGRCINDAHPVMDGYNYNDIIYGSAFDSRYYSSTIASTSAGPYYTPLVKEGIGSNFDYVVALDAPYAGRVVHIWDAQHWGTATNQPMILNAIDWVNPGGYYKVDLLTPINTSSIFNGWNNFSWTSLELPCGPVNYTLQISNISDFTFVNIEQTKILETPVNTIVEIDVDLVADLYFWRVRAHYGIFNSNWSEVFTFNLTINNFAPNLTSEEVIPLSGSQLTLFNFTVIYSDQDNNPPIYVNVTINGTSYSMNQVNLLDTDYSDGCIFQKLIKLSPAAFNYTYSFICYDGKYANSTILYDNLEVTEINLIAPNLINPQLNPSIGDNSTLFIFTVWYYDIENNQLTIINITINDTGTFLMEKADPLDFNATDGILYYYNTTLPWGYYKFQINCSDGVFTNSTGWIIGPEVNPFLGLTQNITLFEDDFESGLAKWETVTGLWHLTDSGSSWSDPYHSYEHSMWFGNESTGNYDTGSIETGELISVPFDLSTVTTAILEFYHWRIVEGGAPYDVSRVYISIDGFTWDLLYEDYDNVLPAWQREVFDISSYCGNSSVQIRFFFDTVDEWINDYRGWLIDDVKVYTIGTLNLLTPINTSSIFTGWNDFSWTSLDAFFGPSNYTLQISNSPDFSSIRIEKTQIPEMSIETSILINVQLPGGQYYWRVRANYGVLKSNWSNTFTFTILEITVDDDDDDDDTKLSHDIQTLIIMIIILGASVLGTIATIVLVKKRRAKKNINKEYTPGKNIFYDK